MTSVLSLRLDRRLAPRLLAAALALAALIGIGIVAGQAAPRATATGADLAAQRAATERAIARIYAAAIDQLKLTRSLHLAITDAQAGAIEQKYIDQLKALRRSALTAVANAYGETGDAASQYVTRAESRLDQPLPSAAPVMLAPALYQIVQRMGELAAGLQDAGIREMTMGPSASPSGSRSASPSVSPARVPSPSPTR